MKRKRLVYLIVILVILFFAGKWAFTHFNFNPKYTVGEKIDNLNGVYVYYNGGVSNISGRNLTADGYNLGMKYQCVEFVKRYYCEQLDHKMPDSYGNAKDFFDKELKDGEKNLKRNLLQYTNPGNTKPETDDLLIYSASVSNQYGHVAIVSKVTDKEIEVVQQNPGPYGSSRETFTLSRENGAWKIGNDRIMGWLRKEKQNTVIAQQ